MSAGVSVVMSASVLRTPDKYGDSHVDGASTTVSRDPAVYRVQGEGRGERAKRGRGEGGGR